VLDFLLGDCDIIIPGAVVYVQTSRT